MPSDSADVSTVLELAGKHTHADEVGTVNAFERLSPPRPSHPAVACPWRPSRVKSPCHIPRHRKSTGRRAGGDVLHRCVVDEHLCAPRVANRVSAAFHARAVGFQRQHQVFDAHVGECAAHHHFVVAAPRAVAVEIGLSSRCCSMRYLPAGEVSLIEPAGEMWSVVTESPKMPNDFARHSHLSPCTGAHAEVSCQKTAARRCRWTFGQSYTWPDTPLMFCHSGLSAPRLE